MKCFLLLIAGMATSALLHAQQVADSSFDYHLSAPAYPTGKGPVVTLDEAHLNFHTLGGRYYAFGKLLARDGYVMRSGTAAFRPDELSQTKILVIANALADTGAWRLPAKSAFTTEEIEVVRQWVSEGGSLFIIADHMPFAGTTASLAAAFGFNFFDGFAVRNDGKAEMFSRTQSNLHPGPITDGRNAAERIDSICVFTGQAFLPPPGASVISSLGESYTILLPTVAWEFADNTPRLSGRGLVNGAYIGYGKGKLVAMGEAAMFSAQLAGPRRNKTGMNHPRALQNPQLLLNIIHWLDGKL